METSSGVFGMLTAMSLILRAAAISNPGLIRANNEDSVHAGQWLIAVADGIGGLPAGEVASHIAIRKLAALDVALEQGAEPLAVMRDAIELANREVRQAVEADPRNEGMGTTVTALLLAKDQVALAHVGDSRAYLLRGGELLQLTKDDTYVQTLVDQGVLTLEEARSHPHRSVITQAVQGRELTMTGALLTPLVGDRYLLCSDGLSDVITDETIGEVLRSLPEPRRCAERLVKLTLRAGAPDNVTVVVADVEDGGHQ
jgi:protein phosphatase